MARVLVAGAEDLGCALAERLVSEGHEVYGLEPQGLELPPGVHVITADVTQATSLSRLPNDIELAFYAVETAQHDDETYRRHYVDGVRNLAAALAARGGLRRFFYASSTGVYHQDDGSWVDEASPTHPTEFNGKRVLEGERVLAESGLPATSIRFGGIYGRGRARVVEWIRSGRARLYSGGPSYTNRIHRDDCLGMFLHLMELEEPEPLYVGVDSDPCDFNELMTWLAHAFRMPTPETLKATRSSNKRCSNARILASGYELLYPSFKDGYTDIIAHEAW